MAVTGGDPDGGDGGSDESAATSLESLDVAVAHWHVRSWGGAEYLATRLAEALGDSVVHTLGDPDPDDPNPYGDVRFVDLTPSLAYPRIRRLQRRAGRVFEYAAWEDVDWREHGDPDVLVTSGATTRAVITPEDTLHLHYCHSPPRWFYDRYHDRKESLAGTLARPLLRYFRTRDSAVDPRVDEYLTNSPVVARRLWKYYKRESEVLYPPVDLDRYRDAGDDGYYLHLGRLDAEKGVPEVVEAFTGIDERLVLAGGDGDAGEPVREQVNEISNVEYRGFVSEAEKYDLLSRCRALLFNGRDEDFGIVPVEAIASGKAVLTRDEGFPALLVDEEETGLRHDGSPGGIRAAVERYESDPFSVDPTRAEAFGSERFERRLHELVAARYEAFTARLDTGP